jgi:hypothetical protein
MSDKFKKIWAQMRASEFGPEPLVVELFRDEVLIQTVSSHDGHGSDGLFCEGSGKILDEALDNFSKNLDQILQEEDE